MSPAIRREYARLRALGWKASDALATARVNVSFATMERAGHVRLRIVEDPERHDVSYVDTWTDETPEWRKRMKAKIYARIDAEGLWGIVGEYLSLDGVWREVDSTWDFVGDDHRDSGYDCDIRKATMAAWAADHAARVPGLVAECA